MACLTCSSSQAQRNHSTQLRIVLIGGRESNGGLKGKSSAGNIILGQNVFDTSRRTAQSEVRQQEVFSRQVTVVDTPGWWWVYPREDTPKLDQIEIQNSVHLCPPGPHVFLLVIPVGLYLPELVKASLKQHLELFNADVFSHTIVLFTAIDPCSDEELESRIRTSPVLQWILQQCGNRKHFLNISNREDRDQVKKLLEKIETLITNNGFRHCSVDRRQGETLRKEMRDLTERASKRFDQVQKQRKNLKLQIQGGRTQSQHLRLVLIGAELEGKSSAGNTIMGRPAFCVNNSGSRTTHSEISHSVVEGRRLTVVDSPGWFYINTLQETSEMDKLEIESSVNLCPPGPHAVLLVVGLETATHATCLRSVQEHMSLFREEIWKHTLVLFTMSDWLGTKTVEEHIESDEGLQWIVNKCENRTSQLKGESTSVPNDILPGGIMS
uniref:GTPase IMAP family member 8 n=1 Tax=Poecilia reticulata TaxID=8081 RepID=A0A3P9N6Z4_POERE